MFPPSIFFPSLPGVNNSRRVGPGLQRGHQQLLLLSRPKVSSLPAHLSIPHFHSNFGRKVCPPSVGKKLTLERVNTRVLANLREGGHQAQVHWRNFFTRDVISPIAFEFQSLEIPMRDWQQSESLQIAFLIIPPPCKW